MKAMEALADMQRALGQATAETTGVLDRLASVESEVGLQAQDTLDGAALRRLREVTDAAGLRLDMEWDGETAQFEAREPALESLYGHGRATTIAEAADACREALEGAG